MTKYRAQIWTPGRPIVVKIEASSIHVAARRIRAEHAYPKGFKIEQVI